MKRHIFILELLIFVALSLALSKVVVSNVISTSGVELGSLNEKLSSLRIENDSLKEELFEKTSLGNISSEAAKLGFTDKKENFVLTSPLPVALR